MRLAVFVAVTVLVPSFVLAQLVVKEVTQFKLDDVNALGISMALDSQTVLLGAVGPDAYLFEHDGANWWMDHLKLIGDPWDVTHVSLRGDLALIGVPPLAFIFRNHGGTWFQETVFQDDEPDVFKEFGESVAVGEDVALVASPSRAVHVFRFDGRRWSLEAKLTPERSAGQGAPYGFASALVLDGDRALVHKDSTLGDDFEGTYVFVFDGIEWRQEAVLVLKDPLTPFQGAIALDGDTALINADYDDEVHVFRYDGRSWRRDAVLVPPELGGGCACLASSPAGRAPCSTQHGDFRNFGVSVAIDQGLVLIGAIKGDGGQNEGAAYVYRFDGKCWTHQLTIQPKSTWGFGGTVALHKGSALIRSKYNYEGVYLFRMRDQDR